MNLHPIIHAALRPWIPPGPPRHPGWRIAAEAFARSDPACEECRHSHIEGTLAPYGADQPIDAISMCRLGQNAHDKPEDCPAYQAHVQRLAGNSTEETNLQPS